MNKHALYHKSDSLYSFPLDANTAELRLRAARGDLAKVELFYGQKHAFCLRRKTAPLSLAYSDALYDYFTIRLKLDDKRLAYVFLLTAADGKTYYYSD